MRLPLLALALLAVVLGPVSGCGSSAEPPPRVSKPKRVAARRIEPPPAPESLFPHECPNKDLKASKKAKRKKTSKKAGRRKKKAGSAGAVADRTKHGKRDKKAAKRKKKKKGTRIAKRKSKPSACMPPADWVQKLCEDVYPDVALHLFRSGTPWKRLYMLANAEPFNASGGMSLLGDKMRRGEEVIALRRRSDRMGITVDDTAGYDVLRWNGACATIHDGEFSENRPRDVLHARIEWRQLGLPLRKALKAEPRIRSTYDARRKHCKGFSVGRVTASCVEYDEKLADDIVQYVRGGAKLPDPEEVP